MSNYHWVLTIHMPWAWNCFETIKDEDSPTTTTMQMAGMGNSKTKKQTNKAKQLKSSLH